MHVLDRADKAKHAIGESCADSFPGWSVNKGPEIGVFVGMAAVDMAEIRGRFDGDLTLRKQLVIRATGQVSVKIRYGKRSIEEGGELSGNIGAIGAAPVPAD
jgi:hypothetical protein